MNKKLFSINLNFDSLGEAYGWPKEFVEDAAFTRGVDRILELGNKLNIPISPSSENMIKNFSQELFELYKDIQN